MTKIEVLYYNGSKEVLDLEPTEILELNKSARLRSNFLSLSGKLVLFSNVSHYHEV